MRGTWGLWAGLGLIAMLTPPALLAQSGGTPKSKVIAGNGRSAMDCVKLVTVASGDSKLSGGGRVIANQCGETVEITWCYTDGECARGSGSMWTIGPGKSWPVSATRALRFAACYGKNTVSFEEGSEGSRYICKAPLDGPQPTIKGPYSPQFSGDVGSVAEEAAKPKSAQSVINVSETRPPATYNPAPKPASQPAYTPSTAIPPPSGATPVRFNPMSLQVSEIDYPMDALRNGQQGTSMFRVTISPAGTVTQCVITGSSGSPSLDARTCEIVQQRGRFTPARDAKGNATSGTYSNRMIWILPE